jgi:hypothetical protein
MNQMVKDIIANVEELNLVRVSFLQICPFFKFAKDSGSPHSQGQPSFTDQKGHHVQMCDGSGLCPFFHLNNYHPALRQVIHHNTVPGPAPEA